MNGRLLQPGDRVRHDRLHVREGLVVKATTACVHVLWDGATNPLPMRESAVEYIAPRQETAGD